MHLNNAKQELDFTKTGEDAESLIAALQESAAVYKSLHRKALAAGIKMPRSATIVSDKTAVWSKDDLIGAQDWMSFESRGWAVVDELPELPEGFDRTYFLSQRAGDPPAEIVPVSAPTLLTSSQFLAVYGPSFSRMHGHTRLIRTAVCRSRSSGAAQCAVVV
jgi:hypothetical protein